MNEQRLRLLAEKVRHLFISCREILFVFETTL